VRRDASLAVVLPSRLSPHITTLLATVKRVVYTHPKPGRALQEFKQMAFGSTDVIVAFSSLERLSVMSAGWSIEVVGIYDAIPNGGYDHIQLL
jgi:hypothetical protein